MGSHQLTDENKARVKQGKAALSYFSQTDWLAEGDGNAKKLNKA